jgi:hypothetical protein
LNSKSSSTNTGNTSGNKKKDAVSDKKVIKVLKAAVKEYKEKAENLEKEFKKYVEKNSEMEKEM